MKKFKFNLQTVHKVRELRSEKENLLLSDLKNQAELARSRIAHIEELRKDALESYMKRLSAGAYLDPKEMELNSNHFASLDSLQREAQKVADEKAQACLSQIQVVLEARVEAKVTDKLHENQKMKHQLEFERHEQAGIDELVTNNFARNIQRST